MDALKARILEAAPGQVQETICSAQFVPRAAAFTSLIQMAAKAKQPQKAIEIFEAMSAVGMQPNTFSYSALISALARAGRWQEAERYFSDLRALAERQPEMRPNTVTYAALISAYEKGGELERALSAFRQQLAEGVPPDLITYSSLVTACERAGRVRQAGELLDQLHAGGMVGTHQLYHGLLTSCQAAGEGELALEVFLGMQCAGVRPTSHTVGLLLGALVSSGQVGHSLWLVREALASSYELGTASFNTVLQLLAACGEWGASLGLFRAMRLAGPKAFPDGASAGLLVAACMQGGNAELAGQLTAELAGQGLLQPVGGAAGGAAWPGAGSPPTQPPLPVPLPLPLPLPLSMQADGGQQEDGHGGGKGAACGEHTDGRQHNGARGERADGRQHNGERGGGCMPHGGAAAKALHNNGASSNESPKGVTGSYASIVVVLGAGGAVVWVSSQQEVPYTGRKHAIMVGPESELDLGREAFQQVLAEAKQQGALLPPRHPASQTVRRIGTRIAQAATDGYGGGYQDHLKHMEWEFAVIDSPQVNAFVVPGGKVVVYTGLLRMVRSEAELAAVLAHESAHVVARHAAERITQMGAVEVVRAIAYWVFGLPIPSGPLTAIFFLPNSRKAETEADVIGVQIMARACYDPSAMVSVFEKMGAAEKRDGGDKIPKFLRTHPHSGDRVVAIRKMLPQAEGLYEMSGCEAAGGALAGFRTVMQKLDWGQ
ncbi:Pentatricopeptide repeat-containing mitochondrial [Micractinium conductrix]|uniref:Pentatricopeptide repeat-containing mitochondrial n=1 Tax=Micractinium conductrix TaxID=554055 RepID=A0A2P6V379_9CHLO|nr:Pentatricopeptide repeat-containing mitochondrial [Micractinium conductrix]|eukprot:PSC68549.1 Pentatricopeptide repeat-containing mitochondrial [Micractinium conductrix]